MQFADLIIAPRHRALCIGQRASLCGVSPLERDDHVVALGDRAVDGVIALRCASIRDAAGKRRRKDSSAADCAGAEAANIEIGV